MSQPFPTDYRTCPECGYRLHAYLFPRVRRARGDARDFARCVSCREAARLGLPSS